MLEDRSLSYAIPFWQLGIEPSSTVACVGAADEAVTNVVTLDFVWDSHYILYFIVCCFLLNRILS